MKGSDNVKTVEVSFREDIYQGIVAQADALNISVDQYITNLVSGSLLLPSDPNSTEFKDLNGNQKTQLTTVKKIIQYSTGLWKQAADALAGKETD